MIRSITERTGCKIEIHDDGRVDIASTDEGAAQQAVDIIKELTAEAELGKTYIGKVVRVVNFGAFVEILPGVEGLLHISELADHKVENPEDVVKVGQIDMVVPDTLGELAIELTMTAGDRTSRNRYTTAVTLPPGA